MNDILLIYWPFGPSFKDRIKTNLKTFEAYKFFDVLILTDDVSYFDDLDYPNVKTLDINECRKNYPELDEYEVLPQEKIDDKQYKKELFDLFSQQQQFPCNVQRYGLLYENIDKYKFISILDCDMIPTHTEEDFSIMLNYLKNILPDNSMATNRAYYFWNTEQNIELLNRYKVELNKDVEIGFPIDGCDSLFKIFKFENPSKIREFFDVWHHLVLEAYQGKNHLKSGSWNVLPEEILAMTYKLAGLTVQHWDVDYASLSKLIPLNFPEDRYWEDWTHQDFDTNVETKKEFIEKNYNKLKAYYEIQNLKFPY